MKWSHLSGSWYDIICRLATVHIIVRIYNCIISFFPPRISIARLAMTSLAFIFKEVPTPPLYRIYYKIIMKFSFNNLITSLYNSLCFFLLKNTDFTVCNSWRFFDICKTVNNLRMQYSDLWCESFLPPAFFISQSSLKCKCKTNRKSHRFSYLWPKHKTLTTDRGRRTLYTGHWTNYGYWK
mgnify:CR=1 FL=1